MQLDSGKRKTARAATQTATQAAPGAQDGQVADACAAISLMAYSLYEARGCVDGHALEDWLKAEAPVGQGASAAKAEAARAMVAG
jgi:hypothetical protein